MSKQHRPATPTRALELFDRWLRRPQPILRLELTRILAPLAVLGFMSSRILYADEWLGRGGFRVPHLGASDWRQPLYMPPLPDSIAWLVAGLMVLSGLAVSFGYRPRAAALIFAGLLAFAALSDRLSAFTVSKLSPAIMLALALSPCGRRFGFDAWRARRRKRKMPSKVSGEAVRFFQVLLPAMYSAGGIAKLRGDWLDTPYVLFTLLHDSYQTGVSWALANMLPAPAWVTLQIGTLTFESLAPVWFAAPRTRTAAFLVGIGMHSMIGLMFGPVKWFALLMIALLLGSYLPERWLRRVHALGERLEGALSDTRRSER
jgi:uncharacterized membrane protein YphA (DoxX/SURF4 family)